MFQVNPVEGKGFGIVATKFIKKGVLILQEDPQIQIEPNEESQRGEDLMSSIVANPGSWKIWINKLWSLFNQMEESDQKEYLELYNSFEGEIHVLGKVMLLVLVNQMKENEEDDAEKILDIVFIYFSNYRVGGKVMIKISRFNHSCRPNAVLKSDTNQIWALSDIKPGQEISIDYCAGEGFLGLRSKESRKIYIRQNVLGEQISCSCDFCKEEQEGIFYPGIRYQTLLQSKMDELIAEIEKLEEELETAKQPHSEQDNKGVFEMFPPGKCRILVLRYKQLYKLSTEKKAQPFYLYHIVKDGYTAAYWFYEVCYTLDLQHKEIAGEFKNICIMFAKAAAGFGKHLGKAYVDVNEWKKRQNFDKYFMDDITDYVVHATRGWALASPGVGVTVNPIQISLLTRLEQITALSDLKP